MSRQQVALLPTDWEGRIRDWVNAKVGDRLVRQVRQWIVDAEQNPAEVARAQEP